MGVRSETRRALLLFIVGIGACSAPPLAPKSTPFPGFTVEIDESPTWSHDGRTIAFHRRIPSSYGPAGVYVTTPLGAEPRFLAPGGLFFPTDLAFSPDDRHLAGVDGYQLWVCELATGLVSRPTYTSAIVSSPDWSPVGKKILYARDIFASPPDSGGIRVFDFETGSDTAVKVGGQIIGTTEAPLWTRDGKWIACQEVFGTDPVKFSLVKANGSERRVIISTSGDWGGIQRYYRPAHGRDGFIFYQRSASAPESGSYYVNSDGSGLVRTAKRFIFMRAFSPDGSEYVWGSADPSDTNYVLAVFQTDDATGTSRRPITRYLPPPGQTLEQALALAARAHRGPKRSAFWGRARRE